MGRPRKQASSLPPCVYKKHGAFWFVKKNTWTRLGSDLHAALLTYADLAARAERPAGGMPALIQAAMPGILRGKSASTTRLYTLAAGKLCQAFAEFAPDQVRPVHVKRCADAWADTPGMSRHRLVVLQKVFDYAVSEELVESNPCLGIKRAPSAKRRRYVTHDEYQRIWRAASPDCRVLMDLLYITGQRIDDVLHIRHEDVSDAGVYVQQRKTGARVLVMMTPDLRDVLNAAAALPRQTRGATVLCTIRGGRRYDYKTAYDMFKLAADKASVPDVTPHDLRAKSLTDAKAQGLDPQALGGHSTEAMTLRYIRQIETTVAQPPSIRQTRNVLDNQSAHG